MTQADATMSPERTGWRRAHPRLARVLLYGAGLLVLAGGAVWASHVRDAARQDALATRLSGVDAYVLLDPERAIREVETEILPSDPAPDILLAAHMKLAAAKDALFRYEESERHYRDAEAAWPAASPKGLLYVPWANMCVSAGRPRDALAMLDRPGGTDGWTPRETIGMVRDRAAQAISALSGAPPAVAPTR